MGKIYLNEEVFSGEEGINYSTTEQKTKDTWIDGKPIYQITIQLSYIKQSSWVTENHSISNIDNIVGFDSYVVDSGTRYNVPQYRSNSAYFIIGITSSVIYYINSWLDPGTMTLTVRYTKTTD